MSRWHGLAIVITNRRRDDAAIVAVEALDVAVERKIFTVFVVAAVADHVADVVKHRCRLE